MNYYFLENTILFMIESNLDVNILEPRFFLKIILQNRIKQLISFKKFWFFSMISTLLIRICNLN